MYQDSKSLASDRDISTILEYNILRDVTKLSYLEERNFKTREAVR
jgi:hypothetical protein